MTHRSKALLGAFLTATALGMGATAYSQTAGPLWDSSQLPETRGLVKQYTPTVGSRLDFTANLIEPSRPAGMPAFDRGSRARTERRHQGRRRTFLQASPRRWARSPSRLSERQGDHYPRGGGIR
jgi:hypothetical protein